jgi:hypothetical protein
VLPEFALPPDAKDVSPAQIIKGLADNAQHEFFLFSGSRHEGVYNRGFIVSRERELGVSDVWWHYKVAAARGLGENIMGPQYRKLPSYDFRLPSPDNPGNPEKDMHCKLFVAICYDVFDPTTFINYVVQCADSDAIMHENIILVPSFNPGEEFVHALRDLSFVARCPVIYVNGLHGDATLFLFGIAISDIAAMESQKLPSRRSRRKPQAGRPVQQDQSAFDHNLHTMMETLEREANEAEQLFHAAKAAGEASSNREFRSRVIHWTRELSDKKRALVSQRKALDDFRSGLQHLRNIGALKHLITKEKCAVCAAKRTHRIDDHCPNDVLYYNIDLRLYSLLKDFRNDFFNQDDKFLPLPFRESQRKMILTKIQRKRDERSRRAERLARTR